MLANKSGNHVEEPESSHGGTRLWKSPAFCLSFSTLKITTATKLTNDAYSSILKRLSDASPMTSFGFPHGHMQNFALN